MIVLSDLIITFALPSLVLPGGIRSINEKQNEWEGFSHSSKGTTKECMYRNGAKELISGPIFMGKLDPVVLLFIYDVMQM